jgi:CBS domain-containing protein
MNIGSICTRHIVSLGSGDLLQRAATLMREQHVGALVVTETSAEGARVTGIVTDRDLAIEVLARGDDASRLLVGDVASSHLVSAPEDTELAEAVDLMVSAGVRRLLVHDADGHLVGLVSFDDLLPACIAPLAGLSEVLRKGIEREVAERGAIAAPPRPVLRVPAVGTVGWTTD